MNPLETVEIGASGLRVTRLGMGGAPLGGLFADVEEANAVETIRRGLQLGVCYFDTAPLYGLGKSERYYGRALAGIQRDQFVLSTKVGRVLEPSERPPEGDIFINQPPLRAAFDFSREGVLRSLEESLERLGLERVDILFIHDPDDHHRQAVEEAYPTLDELRAHGVVRAIGVGMNYWEPLARFARECDFDCFLLAGRYTLLDQSGLEELLPLCEQRRISVILGGPYNSGILASDLSPGATYFYREAPRQVLEKARRLKAVCDRHGTPLKAAALQFGLAHPAVAATIPGARSAAEAEENFRMVSYPIPPDLWDELRHEKLIPPNAPTP